MSKSLRTLTSVGGPSIHRSPLTYSRTSIRYRHSLTKENGVVRIQPVKITKGPLPARIRRRLFQYSAVVSIAGAVSWYFDLLKDDEGEEEQQKNAKVGVPGKVAPEFQYLEEPKQAEKGEEEEDLEVDIPEELPEDAIFIPLGFTRQRPQEFYKGSDPEWRSFIDFRRDRDREKKVRHELTLLVANQISGMKSMQRGLGTPIKIVRAWTDVIIPDGPPPEFERSGLEIGDDYMALTTRPISQLQNARFQAAIFPLPVIQSFWASFSTSWSLQFAKVKHYFKLDTNADGAQSSLPRGMTSLDQLQENNAKREPQSPNRMDKMSDPKAAEDNPARGSSKPNPKDPFPDRSKILTNLPTIQSISGDNGAAMTAFKRTLAKNWKPPHEFGERGTLLMYRLHIIRKSPDILMWLAVFEAFVPDSNGLEVVLDVIP